MERIIIQVTPKQREKLRKRAKELKISVAEYIRRAIDVDLAEPGSDENRKKLALSVIGCAHSGTGDVSERHNEYFADAVREG